jgi:hypothetical protein
MNGSLSSADEGKQEGAWHDLARLLPARRASIVPDHGGHEVTIELARALL